MGFNKMSKKHAHYLKTIKAQLPRRESERRFVFSAIPSMASIVFILLRFRNHPLARHADILTCIETRMSMLSMTYTKYIEVNLCCFIPGKVISSNVQALSVPIYICDINFRLSMRFYRY